MQYGAVRKCGSVFPFVESKMNARQRKLLLHRTVLKRVKTKTETQPAFIEHQVVGRIPRSPAVREAAEEASWEVVDTPKVVMIDMEWKPCSEFQAQSRLSRNQDGFIFDAPLENIPRMDWDDLKKQIELQGGIKNVAIPAVMPPHSGEGKEDAVLPLPQIKLHDYQIEAMNRIRAMGPNIVLEMPSRHSHSLITALRQVEQQPMILMSPLRKHDDDSVLSTMSIKMLKERILSGDGGQFRVNLENLSITDEPEENK
jgi:hypothetical protein